jgi:hypothetical protein
MSTAPCKGWSKRFAKVTNAWLMCVAMSNASATEFRVLFFYVARTWGDFDGKRGQAGRPWVRLSSREIGEQLGLSDSRVRKATEGLVAKRLLRRYHPAVGRRAAAIGPEPLLPALALEEQEAQSEECAPLDEIVAELSPRLRVAVEEGRAKWQA